MAAAGSQWYVELAGLAALMAGVMLLFARIIRLGFLANFLSRTVLIGFLTGVGVQVAAGQLPDMVGVDANGHGSLGQLVDTVRQLPSWRPGTIAVSVGVLVVLLVPGKVTRRIPAALVAVVGAILLSRAADLAGHGVAVLGTVPSGPPAVHRAAARVG